MMIRLMMLDSVLRRWRDNPNATLRQILAQASVTLVGHEPAGMDEPLTIAAVQEYLQELSDHAPTASAKTILRVRAALQRQGNSGVC